MLGKPGGLGNRKPSNLLMKIHTLSGASYEALERAMFLNQLPPAVRMALANSKAANNEELGMEADTVMEEFQLGNEMLGHPHVIAAVSSSPPEVDAAFRPRDDQHSRQRPQGAL